MKNVNGLFCLLLLLALTGCSSFHREWRSEPASTNTIEGRWEGAWKSDANEHGDKLRCLLTQMSPNSYQAKFHARYKKIFGFGYTATFVGSTTNGTFRFSGEADLGALAGGVYRYEGFVNPTNFFSTYRSKYDHGTFRMARPKKP